MEPVVLRFVERLAAVLFGGMAIFLGYRLFLNVPRQKDAEGTVTLPWNTSVVMSRVGPGAFFALFGVIVVSISLLKPLTMEGPVRGKDGTATDATGAGQGKDGAPSFSYIGGKLKADEKTARANARVSLRKDIATLNNIPPRLRADLDGDDKFEVERCLARVKLELMRPVWGSTDEGFGDIASFESWVETQESGTLPPGMNGALELYQYGRKPR